jgi:serine/threonine-protein kinase RsbW
MRRAGVKSQKTVFRASFASSPKNVARVELFLKRVTHSITLDEIQFHKVMVSLTEAVNNAIVHGNQTNQKKRVNLCCEILPGWLLLIVNDQGVGFKPDTVRNPLAKKNLLKESGRGIFLMRTLMDKVEFASTKNGTEVRLWLDTRKC